MGRDVQLYVGLFGVINVFRVDHQSLEEMELEASFSVMLS